MNTVHGAQITCYLNTHASYWQDGGRRECFFFHNSSLPKAFYYGKACYILAQSWQALPHNQLLSHCPLLTALSKHQRHNGKGIASWRLHMEPHRTHMANVTEQPYSLLPLGKHQSSKTLADSDSSALNGFIPQRLFLHSKDKAHTKNYSFSSRATHSYALAQVTVSTTSTWAKHMWNSETVPY